MTYTDAPRVLLVTRYFPPLDSVATFRMYSWAKYLHALGWSVSVLTTSKKRQVVTPLTFDVSRFEVMAVDYFDPLAAFGLDKAAHLSREVNGQGGRAGIRGLAARMYRDRFNERMPGRTDAWILPALREVARRQEQGVSYDYVISSYGPPSAHVVGHRAARVFGAKWIADYRDLWLENHIYRGIWPFTLFERILERRLVSQADLITTVSEGLSCVLRAKFPQVPNVVVLNGFEPELMDAASSGYFDKEQRKFRIVYTGTVYRVRQDPSPLFEAIRRLIDRGTFLASDLEVLFYGNSPGDVPQLAEAHGLHNVVKYLGPVPQSEAHSIQKSADLLLFLEAGRSKVEGVLTGKLFEYLYVDVPLIAVGVHHESAPGRFIREASAGVVCGDDVSKIEQVLTEFMLGGKTVTRNRAYISAFSRQQQVKNLAEGIESLSPKGP